MKNRIKNFLILLLDMIIIGGGGLYALYQYCYDSIENIVTNVHKFYEENSFSYFTTLSNIFLMIVSLIDIPFRITGLIKGNYPNPKWLFILRFMSTVYIIMTFLIVNLVLVWLVEEPFELYEGKELFTHVLLPVIATTCYFISPSYKFDKKIMFAPLYAMIAYSIYYYLKVFTFKVWSDFYSVGFLYPWSVLIFIVLIVGATIGISALILKLKNSRKRFEN